MVDVIRVVCVAAVGGTGTVRGAVVFVVLHLGFPSHCIWVTNNHTPWGYH
ncbi:aspartate/tyrosine/aromatic aminotransferase [Leucobacter aridicollis]|uniref:Aspartate/tyrosine/aromatic aminotransferase n=1 Tax=Leucobacter aridicollis TaxID=283878 RepID=A0A852R4A6_9MICO|nr:aspartate/tyrosine/aromatic aminotransferase [Leucobacter aridicollis]